MLTKVIPEEKVIATYKAIQRARRIVIVAHKRPDGDAIGSCLGLYHFLYSFERETFVILPDAIPANMSILPSSSEIINFEQNEEHCKTIIAETDLIFCLDFNNLSRIGELGKLIADSAAEKIMIDHHLDYHPLQMCVSLIPRLHRPANWYLDLSVAWAILPIWVCKQPNVFVRVC